ncbi:MAG: metal ABC transporter solute-binding protein, Zn/Mn family [Bacteroidales bacterium]
MKESLKYSLLPLIVLFGVLFFQLSCNRSHNPKRTIAVTIQPQKYFAERLAGDKFDIFCVVPSGSSPESYDPSASLVLQLGKSDAYFKVGELGFELAWMDKIQHNNPDLKIFDLSQGIEPVVGTHMCIHDEDDSHSHEISSTDPHYWNSPKEVKIMLQNMCNAFIELDPENEDYYKNNLKTILEEVEDVDSEIQSILTNNKSSAFLIYHPALSYFARDYGLKQLSIEENGKEPTPNHLKNLIDSARTNNIHVIFVQREFDTNNAAVIAGETQSMIIEIDPLNYNWKHEMIRIANAFIHE